MPSSANNAAELRSVALLSPGWPVASMANGIVSYVGTVRAGLESLGLDCHVLASILNTADSDARVHPITVAAGSLADKIYCKLSPLRWHVQAFARSLLNTTRRLHTDQGLQLLEMEETFGWARFFGPASPVPVIVRLHGPWFLNGAANGARPDKAFHTRDAWEKAGILAADGITAPSQNVLDETRQHYGIELAGAQVIPNPVETVPPANRWSLQSCDPRRIAFIGRFDRHKGGDLMLDAFAKVADRFPDARLDFVGPDRGCIDDAGREWKIAEYLAQKLSEPTRARVTYHGFQPATKAAEIRRRAMMTVIPSRYETFGIAAAEAMMAGCPVIASAAGALTELVQDGQNGLLARAANAEDLAEKMIRLLNDPQQAAKLGRQAADDAAERYAPPVIARRTAEFYRTVLARVPGKSMSHRMPAQGSRPAGVPA